MQLLGKSFYKELLQAEEGKAACHPPAPTNGTGRVQAKDRQTKLGEAPNSQHTEIRI